MTLSTSSNFARPDDAFRAVVEAHRGLSDEQSADLDAALVLILANHIGDLDVLREAIALAQRRMADASQQNNSSSSNSDEACLKAVIASEAKQSIFSGEGRRKLDCFVASAPRNDVDRTEISHRELN